MARSGFLQTTLAGYVGQNPESKFLDSGTQVANFSVAYTDRQDNTSWYRVSAFGKLADIVSQYVTKGRQVLVVGEPSVRTYQGRDGETKVSLEIRASDITLLGKREDNGENAAAAPAKATKPTPKAVKAPPVEIEEVDMDSIPY